jgi:hypothetical protein
MGKRFGCAGCGSRARRARGRGDRSGAGCSQGQGQADDVTVEALTTEQNFEGTALGDQIVLTTQLLKGDTEVGHQGGVCTVTSVQRNEAQCVATYSFRGGQITAQALIILGDPAPYAAAITGGSGKYQGVEGEVRVDPASETQPRGILTFHLQD